MAKRPLKPRKNLVKRLIGAITRMVKVQERVLRQQLASTAAGRAESNSPARRSMTPVEEHHATSPSKAAEVLDRRRNSRSKKGLVPLCFGCSSLGCVKGWDEEHINELLRMDEQGVVDWLYNHRICYAESCEICGEKPAGKQGRCSCRRSIYGTLPFKGKRTKLDARLFVAGVYDIARLRPLNDIECNKNTRTALGRYLCRVAACAEAARTLDWNSVQVDETYVGARKDHRGRRARRERFWAVVAAHVARTREVREVLWCECASLQQPSGSNDCGLYVLVTVG